MTTTAPLTIGKAMKIQRVKFNLTQDGLAKKVHCSRQSILSVENGWSNPGYALARRIAAALKLDLNTLEPNDDAKWIA
jgi:DNA-binding XRE family transcriptional regulator